MNKIYKVIWSKVRNCWIVVSELAKGQGKNTSCGGTSLLSMLVMATLLTTGVMHAQALTPEEKNEIKADIVSDLTARMGQKGFIIDNDASVTAAGGVALGIGSVADREAGLQGYISLDKKKTIADGYKAMGDDYDYYTNELTKQDRTYNEYAKKYEDAMKQSEQATDEKKKKRFKKRAESAQAQMAEVLKKKEKIERNIQSMEPVWKSTKGAVSVGVDTNGDRKLETRQITGVAAGTEDTDAVNVAQLKASTTRYFSVHEVTPKETSGSRSKYERTDEWGYTARRNQINDGAVGDGAVAIGENAEALQKYGAALGYGAKAKEERSLALGLRAEAEGNGAVAMGGFSIVEATGKNSIALGHHSRVTAANSIALGSDSFVGKLDDIKTDAYLTGDKDKFTAENGVVSVGRTGYKKWTKEWKLAPQSKHPEEVVTEETVPDAYRRIVNVAGGAEDTDAVNVAQLKALAAESMNFYSGGVKDKNNVYTPGGTNWSMPLNEFHMDFGDGLKAEKVEKGGKTYTLVTLDKDSLKGNSEGQAGTNGKSAYELWKEQTNDQGQQPNKDKTEKQFFDSLKGDKGAEGVAGKDGTDGKSAYDIWKEKTGNTNKSEEEFLQSLKGEKGTAGVAGKDGTNGKSAYDIWKEKTGNTNKSEEEFLQSLKGEKGEKGTDGVAGKDGTDGKSAYVEAGDYVTVTSGQKSGVDGTVYTVKGPKLTSKDTNLTVTDEEETVAGTTDKKKVGYKLELSKTLTGLESVSGKVFNVGNNVTLGETGLTITGGPSVTTTGIDAGSKKIANVTAGVADGDAVNFKQLKDVDGKVTTNTSDITTLKEGWTLEDGNETKGTKTVKAKDTVKVTGDDYITATVNNDGLKLGMNVIKLNTQINDQINNSTTVTNKMNSWVLKAATTDKDSAAKGQTIDNTNNVATFDVETGQGLTVVRDGATIKYGVNNSELVGKINSGNTAVTNISAKFSVTDGINTKAVNLGKDKDNNVKFLGTDGETTVTVGGNDEAPTVTVGLDAKFKKQVNANSDNITTNKNAIQGNTKNITNLTTRVDRHDTAIGENTEKIKQNAKDIAAKMTSWKLKAGGVEGEVEIKDGNEVTFDVKEADKGLTITRDGSTIKYGIEGSEIDISENKTVADLKTDIKNSKTTVTGDEDGSGVKVENVAKTGEPANYKVSLGNKSKAGDVTVDGTEGKGQITGLSNKTWDAGNIVSGRAATEDQLKAVSQNAAEAAKKHTTVVAGDYVTVSEDTNANGGKEYTVTGPKVAVAKDEKNLVVGDIMDGNKKVGYELKLNKELTGLTSVSSTTFKAGDNVTINNEGLTIKDGPSVTTGGINAGDQKITKVADGDVSENSTDAVNGGQLYKLQQTVAGNKVTVEAAKNSQITVTPETQADKSTKYVVNIAKDGTIGGAKDGNLVTGDTVKKYVDANKVTVTGDEDGSGVKVENVAKTGEPANYKVSLGNKIKAGDVTVDGTEGKGQITGLSNKTWDAGNIVSGRAATEDQLKAVSQNAAEAAKKHTTVVAGDYVTVSEDTNANGGKEYTVTGPKVAVAKDEKNLVVGDIMDGNKKVGYELKLNKELTGLTSVSSTTFKAGDNVTINNEGLTIKDGPSVTTGGIKAGDKKITKVADGDVSENSTDAVNGGQLYKLQQTVAGNKVTVEAAKNSQITVTPETQADKSTKYVVNIAKDGTIGGAKDGNLVTGDTVKKYVDANKVTVTGDEDGSGVKVENVAKTGEPANYKVSLGNKIKAGDVTVDGTEGKGQITGLSNKTWDAGNIVSGRAATEDQLKAVSQNAAEAAKKHTTVVAGDYVTVSEDTNANGGKEYTVTGPKVAVAKDEKNLVVGDIMDGNKKVGYELKLNKELTGLTSVSSTTFKAGDNVTINNEGLTIKDGPSVTTDGINAGDVKINGEKGKGTITGLSNTKWDGQRIVSGRAATEDQLQQATKTIQYNMAEMGQRVDRVGAKSAALAALHPLDYDADDKWDFSVAVGNYNGANSAALGAFYRPNERTMISLGGTIGGEDNMVNLGVSFKTGSGVDGQVYTSRTAMAKEIKALKEKDAQREEQLRKLIAIVTAMQHK